MHAEPTPRALAARYEYRRWGAMTGAAAVDDGETVTWGVVGAGTIVRWAILPALTRAANARVLAVARPDARRGAGLGPRRCAPLTLLPPPVGRAPPPILSLLPS